MMRASGVPVTIVRPFSGYGTDQSTAFPFPAIVAKATRRQDLIEIGATADGTSSTSMTS